MNVFTYSLGDAGDKTCRKSSAIVFDGKQHGSAACRVPVNGLHIMKFIILLALQLVQLVLMLYMIYTRE